ncbi:hypothetical protein PLESTM_000037200 [Pleodorina starrii]|nr:hypothetical protein PLESTM_000037200 [Pleodorina starrii]
MAAEAGPGVEARGIVAEGEAASEQQRRQQQQQGRGPKTPREGSCGGPGGAQRPQQPQQQAFLPSELPPGTVIEDASSAPQPHDYVFVDGLRLVKPYYFDFKCFVKKRQDGKPLMQLMAEEFPMLSDEYYRQAVVTGRLRVEASSSFPNLGPGSAKSAAGATRAAAAGASGGSVWAPERPLRAGMCIRHFIHRHEPPVLAGDVQILGITSDFVAVNKPACLPVHTVGQYRKNTVMGVVQAMRPDLWPLYPTYRLDKPVSGVLLLARSSAVAGRMRILLEERGCSKAYVARVQGVFPDTDATGGPLVVDVSLGWDAKTNHAMPVPPGAAAGAPPAGASGAPLPRAPLLTPELVASAKPAETHFRRLSVAPDGLTSVVEAVPKTGRTHQIRVHLQYLGHPIANDTQYGGSYGMPLFFRRGMGGPARPHVNGQRRRVAEERLGEADPAGGGGGVAAAAAQAPCSSGSDPEPAAHPGGGGPGPAGAAGGDLPADADGAGSAPTPGAHKRQRRCTDGLGASGGGEGGGDGTNGAGATTDVLEAAAAGGGGSCAAGCSGQVEVAAGPNADARLVAASSERYLQLYTRPEFQVPGGCADPLCPHCPCLVPEGYPIDLEPLYLHAARYAAPAATGRGGGGGDGAEDSSGTAAGSITEAAQGGGGEAWSFEAPLPDWAQPGYVAVPAGGGG